MIPLAKFAMLRSRAAGRTIAFFNSASASAASVTMPASVLANDIALLFDNAYNSGAAPSSVTPSGWSAIGSSVTTTIEGYGLRCNVSYKVLAGTEGGSSITGMDGLAESKILVVFRPSSGTWGAASSVNAFAGTTTPTDQTVTVGTAPGIVLAWAYDGYDGAPGLGMSPAAGGGLSNSGLDVGYIIYNSGAANNTVSNTMGGGDVPGGAMGSFWLPLGA